MRRPILLSLLLLSVAAYAGAIGAGGVGGTAGGGTVSALLNLETTAAMALFVDPTGSDSNACTATGTAACLTLQGAVDKVPKYINHLVTITAATGNYAGFAMSGFTCKRPTTAISTGLQVIGTLITATAATGSPTGTATSATAISGSVHATLTDAAATWTVDDFAGKLLEITSGTGATTTVPMVVASNTATVITLVGGWPFGTPDGTSVYALRDWGAVVTTNAPSITLLNQTNAAAGTYIAGNTEFGHTCFGVYKMKYTNTTGNALSIYGELIPAIRFNRFANSAASSSAVLMGAGAGIFYRSNSLLGTASAYNLSWGSVTTGLATAGVFISSSYFSGGLGISNGGAAQMISVIDSHAFNFTAAGLTPTGSWMNLNVDRTILNCNSGASTSGLRMTRTSTSMPGGGMALVQRSNISNCTTAAIQVQGDQSVHLLTNVGATNTIVASATEGGSIKVASDVTTAGTTELSLDGVAYTYAAMRAASPKTVMNLTYGSKVYE